MKSIRNFDQALAAERVFVRRMVRAIAAEFYEQPYDPGYHVDPLEPEDLTGELEAMPVEMSPDIAPPDLLAVQDNELAGILAHERGL